MGCPWPDLAASKIIPQRLRRLCPSASVPRMRAFPLLALASSSVLAVLSSGCGRQCGIGLEPSGVVSKNGSVDFGSVTVGQSQQQSVAVVDMLGSAETITQARISGPNRSDFQVLTTFPLAVPLDGGTSIVIQFAPGQTGGASAELTLTTDVNMPMEAPMSGTGVSGN